MSDLRMCKVLLAVFTLGLSEWKPAKRFGRLMLHRIGRAILRLRAQNYDITKHQTALVLAPHPDDEAFGCGGLIACKRLEGHSVHVVFVTDGRASHPGHPALTPAVLAGIRQQEALESLDKLGVDPAAVYFFAIQDGTLAHLSTSGVAEITGRLGQILRTTHPDEIFLPCRRDGSSEHDAVYLLLQAALETISPRPRVLEFPVWSWWNPFLLLRDCFTRRTVLRIDLDGRALLKRAAIGCHRTQVEPSPPWSRPVQSYDFTRFFLSDEEFFYEN